MKSNPSTIPQRSALLAMTCFALLPQSPLPAQQPQRRVTLRGDAGPVTSVAFSPDGKTLASGHAGWEAVDSAKRPGQADYSVRRALDTEVLLWDVRTGKQAARLRGRTAFVYSHPVFSVAFSPDGKTLASGSEDRSVALWDVRTGHVRATFKGHTHWVTFVAYSPDGGTLASGGTDGTVRLWDVATGKNTATFGGDTPIYPFGFPVAFSPDGKRWAAGRNKVTGFKSDEIRLWEAPTRTERVRIPHEGTVTSLAFSPDGKTLASARGDETIRFWDVTTGKNTATIASRQPGGIAFSPDGKTLVTWSRDQAVRLWEVTKGENTVTIEAGSRVSSVTFSPDGKTLAAGGLDGAVYLWDMRASEEPAKYYPGEEEPQT